LSNKLYFVKNNTKS